VLGGGGSWWVSTIISCVKKFYPHIKAVSVSWNNEHETKYTQTYDNFRSYDKETQSSFRKFLKSHNNSIGYWNSRWKLPHPNYLGNSIRYPYKNFDQICQPLIGGPPGQMEQFKNGGQFIMDWYAFRRSILQEVILLNFATFFFQNISQCIFKFSTFNFFYLSLYCQKFFYPIIKII